MLKKHKRLFIKLNGFFYNDLFCLFLIEDEKQFFYTNLRRLDRQV